MANYQNWIGRQTVQHDRLTPALLQRFRATIDSAETGDIAPQAIHWVLCTPEAATAQLGIDGHPQRSDSPDSFFPPVPYPRRMWASSKVDFVAPIAVDSEIERISTIAAISEKTGSTGSLVFVDVAHETRADGTLAIREQQTLVYREANTAKPTPAPEPVTIDFGAWDFHRTLVPDEALLFRFSAITFNTHRIHYDAPYATNEEGYRGLVVHGPLTASLLLDLAARQFGANSVKQFAFRAQNPAFAGEPLHLVGRHEGDMLTLAALNPAGQTVITAEGNL
ncbi:MAG: MaoC family dehydratase N-terminal domain-containing protein [Sphingomonadales bacterium]|jgi:3-methylfumaryl-CoA hydratase|nr:MaoC family dehydratase N-terminal domain-containing protein [Sphingomonadales bacterium]MBK9003048.1 MaoC family dehydratase N-terminal domain-containing protein [Sphingomonadales bacterium]MBK9268296.1 MaoC family dehydratase N-terminal domain-containing protein [Sphingomonadales bacterium]MBP6435041.1 MaoC family dehydratase N-terminal domain-containing protein [Sphingorhabdus sp.]